MLEWGTGQQLTDDELEELYQRWKASMLLAELPPRLEPAPKADKMWAFVGGTTLLSIIAFVSLVYEACK